MPWKIAAGVLGALLLAVGFLAWGQQARIDDCSKKRQEAETALSTLRGTTKLQNDEIETMRREAAEREQKAAQALAEARRVAQARQGQIKALQARILVAERSDCGSAVVEIREMLK